MFPNYVKIGRRFENRALPVVERLSVMLEGEVHSQKPLNRCNIPDYRIEGAFGILICEVKRTLRESGVLQLERYIQTAKTLFPEQDVFGVFLVGSLDLVEVRGIVRPLIFPSTVDFLSRVRPFPVFFI